MPDNRNQWDSLSRIGALLLALLVGIPLGLALGAALAIPAWPYGV
ncbi:hypothetical protein SEA_BURRO_46 [Microbacterium phage Burro]|uniref:Uncharacterized protein n=1 Tax=Microbacterium phage Burro TaxID=2315703 RepID=A0A386KMN1_9CAUD|nr:hypothetical protein HWB89_gp46 [Microbacterium phage Burro]AYD86189.1 hypothetical protein SEA_BURRO_46 [Microbacterium phage Burro]